MRTTLTLDPDVADKLKRLAHQRRETFKQTVNDILRRGLSAQTSRATRTRFEVVPLRSAFAPGVDQLRINQLADELEVKDFVEEMNKG
jgi:hypothetical protein